jgi:two-component system, OmpR family, sensor histidine kinase KdpD
VVDAAIGGTAPALVAALAGSLLVNWFFTPPLYTFTIAEAENVLALGVFLLTAGIVSWLVSVAARRRAEAARASAEARTLSALASGVVETDPLPVLLSHLRRAFGLAGVALLRHEGDGWVVEAADGDSVTTPDAADDAHPMGSGLVLVLSGGNLAAEDRGVLNAFAANLAAALDRRRLHTQAAEAAALAEADELRRALLEAVSHDLRTPLAGIKASVSSLRQPDLAWSPEQTDEFLETVEQETDRLTALVDNLLDMSRIRADAVAPVLRPSSLDEVVPAALASLGARAHEVAVDVDETVPLVDADPALLERVIANLVHNALAHSDGHGVPVHVEAGAVGGRVLLRIVDRGVGIPVEDRERVFQPFQRLDDTAPRRGAGVGLGLAVARGFTRAMGGDLTVEDTPGGGTTMVVELGARE